VGIECLILDRAQTADGSIDLDQFAGQRLKSPEFGDLRLGLAHGCRGGEIPGSGFAADLLGELKVRTMSGVVRFGAVTPRFSAAAGGAGDGARLEVAEYGDLPKECGSVVNQGGKWISREVLLLTVFTTLRFEPQRKENPHRVTSMSRTQPVRVREMKVMGFPDSRGNPPAPERIRYADS
jgi:hypothetical protein